jgi:hypothetical protein
MDDEGVQMIGLSKNGEEKNMAADLVLLGGSHDIFDAQQQSYN